MLAAHGVFPARFQGEPDRDNDGIPDQCDNCPFIGNEGQLDGDGNGIGDACEVMEGRFQPGSDTWTTSQLDTDHTFDPAIPADFFGPGSEPFGGTVNLTGEPLQPGLGLTDTIVNRLDELNLPTVPSTDTVPVEMVALSLVGVQPITVTFNGGSETRDFDVFVDLSPLHDQQGSLTATRTSNEGGTFDSAFNVTPRFTFTRVDPPHDQFVLDGGDMVPQLLVEMESTQVPWTTTPGPGVAILNNCPPVFFRSTPNFGVGWAWNPLAQKVECVNGTEFAMLAAHGVIPALPDPFIDADADLVEDRCDNCWMDVNPMQEDSDNDFIGNVCEDCDVDNDNIWNLTDWFLRTRTWLQNPALTPGFDLDQNNRIDVRDFIGGLRCYPFDC